MTAVLVKRSIIHSLSKGVVGETMNYRYTIKVV